MLDVTEPVDPLHRECINARVDINTAFREAQAEVARWTPRRCPADWR